MDSAALLVALVVASAATAANAQSLFKSTMPDGRVVYGESPQPGARRVDKVAAPPERAGVMVASPEEKERAAALVPREGGAGGIPLPARPPLQPAQQGYSANPDGRLPGSY